MAGAGLSWVSLLPSRERRLWLFGAAVVSTVLALVFGGGAAIASDPVLWAAAGAAALAAGLALRAAQRGLDPMRMAIDADGAMWLHRGQRLDDESDDAPPERLLPRVAGDRLVTFSSAAGPVLVWRDSLPADAFRRLNAHARWHVERAPRQPTAAP
jgi:hypothetical protein